MSLPAVEPQARRVFHDSAAVLRKLRKARRFDREAAASPMATDLTNLWLAGNRELVLHLEQQGGFDRIAQLAADERVEKALSDSATALIRQLLEGFDWFLELPAKAQAIVEEHLPKTFDDAGQFTLGQLGFADVSFELRDPRIRQALLERAQSVIFSGRGYIERVMGTIARRFFDRGEVPVNEDFLEQIAEEMDDAGVYEARRLALTETGIAAELAQVETMRRNGVPGKTWNTFDDELVRSSHQVLDGRTVGIDEKFDVGGSPGDHPMDPTLPAEEIIHCRCWLTAAFEGDFTIEPELAWRGEER